MVIRELSYVLRRDPKTGDDGLTPVSTAPDGMPDHLLERVVIATHDAGPLARPALSYTRLPHRDGGGLLCSSRPDGKEAGLRIDVLHYAAGDDVAALPQRPVDAWR